MWPAPRYREEKMQKRKEDIDLEGQFWKRTQVYLDAQRNKEHKGGELCVSGDEGDS